MSLIDWKSTEATRIAAHTIRMLGEPDVIQAKETGRAVWKNAPIVAMANARQMKPTAEQTNLLVGHVIQNFQANGKYLPGYLEVSIEDDDRVGSKYPIKRPTFLKASISADLLPSIGDRVSQISDTLSYDKENKVLSAKCHFLPGAVLQLYIAKRIQDNVSGRESFSVNREIMDARKKYHKLYPFVLADYEEAMSCCGVEDTAGFRIGQPVGNNTLTNLEMALFTPGVLTDEEEFC